MSRLPAQAPRHTGAPTQHEPTEAKPLTASRGGGGTVRISTEKLDRILDLVGEVVIAKSMIAQSIADGKSGAHLRDAVALLERQTRDLQDSVMAVRMVPIGSVFGRFHRMVRELGTRLGKSVTLEIVGADTEIDKGMVERLADPLTHLVRNALDHSLESPADRERAGKTPTGTLRLSAFHRGGSVVIEVEDDGRGLQTARVLEKAIARGLFAPNANPSVEELHAIVFEPGFSTATEVSHVSGRGVGMDVVKSNVETLGGCLTFSSEPNVGSLVSMELPLTMAIIDGLLLRVGTSIFALPLGAVLESLRPKPSDVGSVLARGRVLQFRGAAVPLVALGDVLAVPFHCSDPTRGIVVVVEAAHETIALLVDELLSSAQVVVKSLEKNYRRVDGIAGATVLGDGQVALILDVAAVVRKAQHAAPARPVVLEMSA